MNWWDIVSAPAKAMTAMPPQKNMETLGLLGKIHQAIDPVQAFGGYGNMAAMALPPGAPKMGASKPLAPAFKMRDGRIVKGKPGETHADLITPEIEHLPGIADMQDGFVMSNGKFLTRAQAMEYIKKADPRSFEMLDELGELSAENYATAKGFTEPY